MNGCQNPLQACRVGGSRGSSKLPKISEVGIFFLGGGGVEKILKKLHKTINHVFVSQFRSLAYVWQIWRCI